MSAPSPPLAPVENRPGEFLFWCSGCGCAHFVRTAEYYRQHGGSGPAWTITGPDEAPTVRASVLVRSTAMPTDQEADRILAGERVDLPKTVCHLFITDGQVRYLADSTHGLAGRTVPLAWPSGAPNDAEA